MLFEEAGLLWGKGAFLRIGRRLLLSRKPQIPLLGFGTTCLKSKTAPRVATGGVLRQEFRQPRSVGLNAAVVVLALEAELFGEFGEA